MDHVCIMITFSNWWWRYHFYFCPMTSSDTHLRTPRTYRINENLTHNTNGTCR
jgi:hypothetical protein